MIIHSKLSKMKNKILPTCLLGNYRHSLGEFSNTTYGMFRTERVNKYVLVKVAQYATSTAHVFLNYAKIMLVFVNYAHFSKKMQKLCFYLLL